MNSIQTIASLTAGIGLLMFLLAIPLILHRVPPNRVYGIRTKASFASDSDWYHINAIGGRYLSVSGLLILLTGIVGGFLPLSLPGPYSITSTIVTLLAVFIPCIRLCLIKPTRIPMKTAATPEKTNRA